MHITPHTYLLTLIREHDGSVRKRRLRALFLTCDSKRSRSESSSEDLNTRTIFDTTARGFKMSMRSAPLRHRPRPSFRFVSRFHSGFITCPFLNPAGTFCHFVTATHCACSVRKEHSHSMTFLIWCAIRFKNINRSIGPHNRSIGPHNRAIDPHNRATLVTHCHLATIQLHA